MGGSNEHMWPKWMKGYFKRTAHDKSLQHWDRIGPLGGQLPPPQLHHGHAVTTTVKGICRPCNNGWMSILETEARPFVEPMLKGRNVILSPAAQRRVAEWITLKMMVWEQAHVASAVFTREQTLAFAATREIPAMSHIWLFRAATLKMRARVTRSFVSLLRVEESAKLPTYLPIGANTQTVLFRAGRLVAYFVNSRIAELELGEFSRRVAKRVWPAQSRALPWPPIETISPSEEDDLAKTLTRYLESPGNVSFG